MTFVLFTFLVVVMVGFIVALHGMGAAQGSGLLCRIVGHVWVQHHDPRRGFYVECEACHARRTPPAASRRAA